MKKTSNIWECKVGINANIANFMCLWKCRIKYLPANLDEEYDYDNQQDEHYDCTDDGTGDGTGRKVIGLVCNLKKEMYRFQGVFTPNEIQPITEIRN